LTSPSTLRFTAPAPGRRILTSIRVPTCFFCVEASGRPSIAHEPLLLSNRQVDSGRSGC
jgi:hypothetical protein